METSFKMHEPRGVQRLAGEQLAGSGPLAVLSGWLVTPRDFSPFAFACPALEQKYQEYQSARVGSHVGIACCLLGILWVFVANLGWHRSLFVVPRLWLFSLPVIVCFAVSCFSSYAPGLFRRNWQASSFATITMHMLLDDEVHISVLALDAANGKQPGGTLLGCEFHRLILFVFFALGVPLSLPAWGLAHMALWVTADYGLAPRRQCIRGVECPSMAWLVSNVLRRIMSNVQRSIIVTYPRQGTHAVFCEVWVMFWRLQAKVIGGVVGVLRDVAWRCSFLRSHLHLIGPDGAARAAAWPFGSPCTTVTCLALLLCLLYVEVMAFSFRVSAGILSKD